MYSTRAYTINDEEQICNLFQIVFSTTFTVEQWRWKYLHHDNLPLSRVAIDTQGNIIGHAGAVALRGQSYGKSMPMYQIADVMVHPQARGYLGTNNLFTILLRELLTDIAHTHRHVLAYGFPGLRPFKLGEYAKLYERIEQAKEFVWNVNELNGSLWLQAVETNWSQIRFNSLWQHLHYQFPISLIRDEEYLIWRYAQNPFRIYNIINLQILGMSVGWAVLHLKNTEALIVDMLITNQFKTQAIRAISGWAQMQGIKTLRLWINSNWQPKLSLAVINTPIIVTNMRWGLPVQTENLYKKFYYTMGDVDIF